MPAGPAAKVNDMSDPLDKLLSPARLNGLPLRNRILKAATFEGMAPGGNTHPQAVRVPQKHRSRGHGTDHPRLLRAGT